MSAQTAQVSPTGNGHRTRRLARIITELSGPAVCAVAGLVLVAARNSHQGLGAAWGGVAVLLCAGVPMAYIGRGVRKGNWSDHHISRREQRYIPLIVASLSVGSAAVLLALVRAPGQLIALILAQLIGLVVVLIVTRLWKISVHAATAAGLLGILFVLYGWPALMGIFALIAVCWSRTVLDAHTWAQVLVGAATGFCIAWLLFPVL